MSMKPRIIGLALFIGIVAFVGFHISNTPVQKKITKLPRAAITKESAGTVASAFDTTDPNESIEETGWTTSGKIMMYTNNNLGVSFHYVSGVGTPVFALTNGNRICVTIDKNDNDCLKGQYVELFTKDRTASLEETLQKQLLKGIDPSTCYAETYKGSNKNYDYMQISYPDSATEEDPFSTATANACPQAYRKTNGMRYFVTDKAHSDRFAFFNIGQYVIPGGDGTAWQDTFIFF